MVEMKVYGLALDEDNQAPVLILKDKDEKAGLPIWIGAMEAMAISLALNKVDFPRPMTHDLLLNTIRAMDGFVERIEVTSLDDGTYYAAIVVRVGETLRRVDSRPSDAVALAVRAECPIFVSQEVLDKAGTPANGQEAVIKTKEGDKWKGLLENLDPDDSKYKM